MTDQNGTIDSVRDYCGLSERTEELQWYVRRRNEEHFVGRQTVDKREPTTASRYVDLAYGVPQSECRMRMSFHRLPLERTELRF
jgi:hypothetical protein